MMKTARLMVIAAGFGMAPLHHAHADHHQQPAAMSITAGMLDAQGKTVGTAIFEATAGGVLITLSAAGIPPGEHGFHIHETGLCDPAEGFKSAGGHFNPASHEHGLRSKAGPHAGDMPNLFAGADGSLKVEVLNANVTLDQGEHSLADADGSALIIHVGADDYATQPTGAAGGRLGCAVIAAPKAK